MKALLNYGLNTLIALLVLVFGQSVFSVAQSVYYSYMPIETFYENISFFAEDACVGDTSHLVHTMRFVHGTDIGYSGELVREMFLYKDERRIKVLEEHAMPFVEVRQDGLVTRKQYLPTDLEEGSYRWVMYLTLLIHGVQRYDIPAIESNIFQITNCDKR